MRTSYSALNTYKNCPLQYKFQNIDKISSPKGIEAVFGSTIHAALNYMFERTPLYPTVDEVVNFFRDFILSSHLSRKKLTTSSTVG